MSKHELVPAYYDGQCRSTAPVFLKSRQDIKLERKSGALNGWYQENGRVFILYRAARIERDPESNASGWGFDTAWGIRPSGYAGPYVWQLKTQRAVTA